MQVATRLLICVTGLLPLLLDAQNCLNGGITFTTQSQIDAFPTSYPTCTHIVGGVQISGSGIQNLGGLAQVSSIGNELYIGGNPVLNDISGLSNLTSVGFQLIISENPVLSSLNGLQNLNTAFGLNIYQNPTLTGLDELSSIQHLSGNLNISGNTALTDLDGLQNLSSVSGSVHITGNSTLSSLSALSDLGTVGGSFGVSNCAISNLNGLQNLQSTGSLGLAQNPNLTSIGQLNSLTALNGNFFLQGNTALPNLNGFVLPTGFNHEIWINDNTSLTSLAGLEAAHFCPNVSVTNNAIVNLTGLNNLQTVTTTLGIASNPNLTSLSALSALTSVGTLGIADNDALASLNGLNALNNADAIYLQYNNSLTNLTALAGLTHLNGALYLEDNDQLQSLMGLHHIQSAGYLTVQGHALLSNLNGLNQINTVGSVTLSDNPLLNDLTALSNLQHVGSELVISNQSALNSLAGLENIDANGLDYLIITGNGSGLTNCAVQGICDFLSLNGYSQIEFNGTGCNTVAEIEAACLALPLELLDFSGKLYSDHAMLYWTIGNIIGSNFFELEKRTQTGEFETIAVIAGETGPSEYSFLDPRILSSPQCYRLKIIDDNGKFVYSPVICLKPPKTDFSLYPNPASHLLFGNGHSGELIRLRLYNTLGILVFDNENDSHIWAIEHLPAGQYLAWINTPQQAFTQKICRE